MNPEEVRVAEAERFKEHLRSTIGTYDRLFVQIVGSGSINYTEINKESIQYLQDFLEKYKAENLKM